MFVFQNHIFNEVAQEMRRQFYTLTTFTETTFDRKPDWDLYKTCKFQFNVLTEQNSAKRWITQRELERTFTKLNQENSLPKPRTNLQCLSHHLNQNSLQSLGVKTARILVLPLCEFTQRFIQLGRRNFGYLASCFSFVWRNVVTTRPSCFVFFIVFWFSCSAI